MSKTILSCRHFCCGRKANGRSIDTKVNKQSSTKISSVQSPETKKLSNHSNIHIPSNIEILSTSNSLNNIDLDRLTKEYLETINEYRFHLGYSSLELSNELTNRAIHRANELSSQNHIENTNRFDLIYNNEPIGETVMSCRAPVTSGIDLAKLIHDQLITDLKNGHSSKKRYTPILNPDCRFLGFGLVRNENRTNDFIVIYYYPVQKNEDLWQINDDSIIQ